MKSILLITIVLSLNTFANSCHYEDGQSELFCDHHIKNIRGVIKKRKVLYAIPKTIRPARGWPVVLMFQGSFFPINFSRKIDSPFGGHNEMKVIKELLDSGFMVIAPRALGNLYWQTNLIGINYEFSRDKVFINRILNKISIGEFGKVDMNNLFATGISSGGYMTDRMFVSHMNFKFNALAIAAASYAKCGGKFCRLPKKLDKNHPPTLFMHGEKDKVVPIRTMRNYVELLKASNVVTRVVEDIDATHQWIDSAPTEVVNWFKLHLK